MTKQTTPHTQTQQNIGAEQADLTVDELEQQAGTRADGEAYSNREGAQTGTNRTHTRLPNIEGDRNTEEETVAHEGTVATRTPQGSMQGISSHSASEESARQEKVVGDREDAQAGVNHSK